MVFCLTGVRGEKPPSLPPSVSRNANYIRKSLRTESMTVERQSEPWTSGTKGETEGFWLCLANLASVLNDVKCKGRGHLSASLIKNSVLLCSVR